MKINTIHIENLRNIESLRLTDLGAAVWLAGHGRQGKTTILQAVELALTGECGLTGKCPAGNIVGRGADVMIRDGANAGTVSLDLDNGHRVMLTIKRKGSNEFVAMDIETGEIVAENRDRWYSDLGIDRRQSYAAIRAGAVLEGQEFSDALADLCAGDVDQDALAQMCGNWWPQVQAYAERHRLILTNADQLGLLGKRAYEDRTAQNAELKQARVDAEALQAVGQPVDHTGRERSPEDLPALRDGITRVEQRIRALHEERGAAAEHAGRDLDAERAALREQIAEAAKSGEATRARESEARDALESAEQQLDELQTAVSTAKHNKARAQAGVREAQANLAVLQDDSGACTTCGRKYTAALREKLLGPLQTLLEQHEAAVADQDAALAEAEHAVAAQREDIKVLREQMQAASSDALGPQRVIARLQAELHALDAVKQTRALDVIDAEIVEAQAKLDRGRELVGRIQQYSDRRSAETRVANAEKQVAFLSRVVELFRDGEAVKKLASGGFGEFEARCNDVLSPLGYGLRLVVSGKTITPVVQTPERGERAYAACSGTEQKVVETAVACAFSDAGGVVLIDEVNQMDAVTRKALLRVVKERAAGSVWLAGAWQQTGSDMGNIARILEPMTLVWVEDGNAEAMIPAQAAGEVAA